jgi:hypothetical protein
LSGYAALNTHQAAECGYDRHEATDYHEVPDQGARMPSYARVSILGAFTGGEVWSINPVFDPTGEFPGWNQANADAATAAIDALTIPSSLLTLLSSSASITGCRLEVRDSATDALIGISIHARGAAVPGSAAPKMPSQAALVLSVRTDTPASGATIATTFRLSIPTSTQFVTDMKTYLTAVQGALAASFPTIGFSLAVRSQTKKTTPHATRIQAGDIIDTQRRRRDRLVESYTSVVFP